MSDDGSPPAEPSPLGRFVASGSPPSSLRGVERKAIRSAVDEAVARAQHLTGTDVSEHTVRYFVDDSLLSRLLERVPPRPPPSDDPAADEHPNADLDIRQAMAAVQTWLARPGRSRDEVLARLAGDVTDAVARSEATDPDDVEGRVDLVLTMVGPLAGDPRVTEVVAATLAVAASRVTGWGMAHSAALAADLLDRRPNPSGAGTMSTRLRILQVVMGWFDDPDQALPRLDIVARLAQSVASDAVGFALRREEVPTAVADLIAGLSRIAALAVPDDVELEAATSTAPFVGRRSVVEPSTLLVADQLLPTMALGPGDADERVAGLALAALAAAVHGDRTRCAVALVDAGVAAHVVGGHRASAIASAAALWLAIGARPSRPDLLRHDLVPAAIAHLKASLAAIDPDDMAGAMAGLIEALDQSGADLGGPSRDWVSTAPGTMPPVPDLVDVVRTTLARLDLAPPDDAGGSRRAWTVKHQQTVRSTTSPSADGSNTLAWLIEVAAALIPAGPGSPPALESIAVLVDQRRDRRTTSAALREEWRRLDRTDPTVLAPVLSRAAGMVLGTPSGPPPALSGALLALRPAESPAEPQP